MAKSKIRSIYTCQNCGAQRPKWEGKCSDCGAWNSYIEDVSVQNADPRGWALGQHSKNGSSNKDPGRPITLDQDLEELVFERLDTGYGELNRVLGGGLARGSFVLLGGSPGIGKSTLLMQMAGGLAKKNAKILYISSEESVSQTGSRAQRLGIRSAKIEIGSESNLNVIMELARKKKPDVLVVDSIQTVYLPELQTAPGTVSQVRESAGYLMTLAKNENIAVILIGHVTKDGSIAGPKVLEHMVDCVLSFEGDLSYQFRLLRSLKNRFGPANELGVFQMQSLGLEEVLNPSELFLEERGASLIGSAVFASMEGTRPLLCEIQALTVDTPMAMPRRTSLGIDPNRLHLLAAVLDRHLDLKLANTDVFINVVGGLKLVEPAADLAMAAALLSTDQRKELNANSCFFGEIGLTGEVRAVSFPDVRLKEANKLGFNTFYVPASNEKHLKDFKAEFFANLESKEKKIIYIKTIRDLMRALFMTR
jgi:DNA repair protein RadA/Sms